MDKFTIIVGVVLEWVALTVIARLWLQSRVRIGPRILLSLVLLIPFVGLLFFVFVGSDLEKNPDRMESQADCDASTNSNSGHH